MSATDPSASLEIHDLTQSGIPTGQQIGSGYMNDAGSQARGLLNQPDHFNDSIAYGNKAQSDAIRSKYMSQFGRNEQKLNSETLLKADADHLKTLQVTSQLANEEVEQNRQKALLLWKQKQAKRAQRGAVVGNVLGIVGAVVGGIYSGGTGAAAGYAAGSAAGNAIGGS